MGLHTYPAFRNVRTMELPIKKRFYIEIQNIKCYQYREDNNESFKKLGYFIVTLLIIVNGRKKFPNFLGVIMTNDTINHKSLPHGISQVYCITLLSSSLVQLLSHERQIYSG